MELAPENPATKALMELCNTLCRQNGVLRRRVEDAATQEHMWLLVNAFSLQVERLKAAYDGISGRYLGRRKTLFHLC